MKNLVIVVFAIAALPNLVPVTGIAEPTHPNEVGLYTAPDGFGATGTDVVWAPVDVYLVLTKPTRMQLGEPHSFIDAFDGQLNFNPAGWILKLEENFPGDPWNIGDADHIDEGYLEYIVAWSGHIPVIDEAVVLISFSFLNTSTSTVQVSLGPCSLPSISGELCFYSTEYQPPILEIMHPVSSSHEAPVFIFNGMAVPVETETFGSVKALYR